jgi:hypothetical protein
MDLALWENGTGEVSELFRFREGASSACPRNFDETSQIAAIVSY